MLKTNASWRTTSLGVIAILTAVLGFAKAVLDSDPTTEPDVAALAAALVAGFGLLFAKDAKVTGLPGSSTAGNP
jgi:hypothetical protein